MKNRTAPWRLALSLRPRFWLSAAIALGVTACAARHENQAPASSSPPPSGTPVTSAKPPSAPALRPLEAQLLPQSSPNTYQVRLSWPASAETEPWILLRDDGSGLQAMTTLEPQSTETVDKTVVAGRSYRYVLARLHGAGNRTEASVDVAIPRDWVVVGEQRYRRVNGIGRLFLRADSRLVGPEGSIEVSVDEIIADGGVIAAFPRGATAAPGQPGRHGGTVVVRARVASGRLPIEVAGESGGEGARGSAGAQGTQGASGARAVLRYVPDYAFRRLVDHSPDAVWKAAADHMRERGPAGIEGLREGMLCAQPPGNGASGARGGTGGVGLPGARGGDGARLFVRITNPAAVRIEPVLAAGTGGKGGPGGPGGKGGPGGAPGERDPGPLCPEAKPGPEGAAGEPGPEGPAGPSGSPAPYCLKLGSASHGDCDQFPDLAPYAE